MEDVDPEQLTHMLMLRDKQGMSDDLFKQALRLLPRRGGKESEPRTLRGPARGTRVRGPRARPHLSTPAVQLLTSAAAYP